MTQVQVYNSGNAQAVGGAWVTLDAPRVDVQLNLGVKDLRDLRNNTAPFSVSFDLPFSPVNILFFRGQSDIQATDSDGPIPSAVQGWGFELFKETPCRLLDSGALIQTGVLQVTAIDRSASVFRCVFFGKNASLFGRMKGKSWVDIFTDDDGNLDDSLNHYLTGDNVVNSWDTAAQDITDGFVGVGTVVYMLTDVGHSEGIYDFAPAYGSPNQGSGWFSQATNSGQNGYNIDGFRPAIRVAYLIKYVIERLGLFLKPGGFLDSSTHNTQALYMMLAGQHRTVIREPQSGFCVNNDFGTLPVGIGQVYNDDISFIQMNTAAPTPNVFEQVYPDLSVFQDSGNQVLPTGYFIIPATGLYTFRVGFYINTADIVANGDAIVQFFALGAQTETIYSANLYSSWNPSAIDAAQVVFTFSKYLEVGFALNLAARVGNVNNDDYRMYVVWKLDSIQINSNPSTRVDMVQNMPEGTVEEWFQGVVDKFNLVVETDPETSEVNIEQYDDWLSAAGDPVDWTDRVDQDGKFLITPATQLQKRRVVFEDALGSDLLNISQQNASQRAKGYTTYESESDWSQGEQRVGDYFAPFRQSFLPAGVSGTQITQVASNIVITSLWNAWENSQVKFESGPPMLAYFHGTELCTDLTGTNVEWYIKDDVTTPRSIVPIWSPNNRATNPDFTLDFASTYQDLGGYVGAPTLGVAQLFWLGYLDEIYDADSRILDCVAYLRPEDLQTLNFGRYVVIENMHFRVLRISNYVVGSDGRCDLSLLKSGSGRRLTCQLTPDLRSTGVVDWYDNTGTLVTGNAFCCNRYGFTWNAATETCYGLVTNDPGNADRLAMLPFNATEGSATQCICVDGTAVVMGNVNDRRSIHHRFELTAYSERSTPAKAQSVTGQQRFQLGNYHSASIKVTFTSVVMDGTNLGETEFGEYTAAVETISYTSTKVDGDVFNRKGGSFVNALITDANQGSYFELECTGKSGDDEQFHLVVEVVTFDRSGQTIPAFAQWQDLDVITYQNQTPMVWNG